MSFNSASEILDAFRELQRAADHFEADAKDWELSPESVESKAEKLEDAFRKFVYLVRAEPH